MTIARILDSKGHNVATIDTATPIYRAICQLAELQIGALVVLNGGRIAGIFSERDLVRALAEQKEGLFESSVDSVMTTEIVTVTSLTTAAEAMELMTNKRIRHLPVVDSGIISGIVSIGDLVKRRLEVTKLEAEALKDYIASA